MNLMAKNCQCPGITTMLSNLTRSINAPINDEMSIWTTEYLEGCGYEIYRIAISPKLDGISQFCFSVYFSHSSNKYQYLLS
jgi:hypothetical protein